MRNQSGTPSTVPLSPEDLEILERFHAAWCAENGVDRGDEAAADIASGLIDWYRLDAKYRERVQLDHGDDLPESPEIEKLLRQIT